jgi:thiamine transport system permease protein
MGLNLETVDGFLKPLGFSLAVGVFASVGAAGFSLSSYFSGMRWISDLGAWVSPVLFSLSVWQVFSGVFTPLSNVVLIQSLFLAPWFSRAVFPLLDRVRNGELEAARTLGADRFQAWMGVEWPRIRGGVLSTLGMIFALSLSEVSSVMLFSKGSFDTLSSFSQNLFTRFRLDEAAFGAVLLLLLSLGAIWVTEEVSA